MSVHGRVLMGCPFKVDGFPETPSHLSLHRDKSHKKLVGVSEKLGNVAMHTTAVVSGNGFCSYC